MTFIPLSEVEAWAKADSAPETEPMKYRLAVEDCVSLAREVLAARKLRGQMEFLSGSFFEDDIRKIAEEALSWYPAPQEEKKP